jgi:hypothetical protein
MTEDHRDGWSPLWVRINTLATVAAAMTSIVALVIAIIALTS